MTPYNIRTCLWNERRTTGAFTQFADHPYGHRSSAHNINLIIAIYAHDFQPCISAHKHISCGQISYGYCYFMSAQTHKDAIASSLEGRAVTTFITILILINAVTLGLETDAETLSDFGAALHFIDRIILVVFSVELALKFYVYRLNFFVQAGIFSIL